MTTFPKTIVVTGGAGFIGSHLCEKYLKLGYRVICVDNLQTTRTPKNIRHLFQHPLFTFIKHDIIRPISFREPIHWVFNFACSGSYTSYQYDPVHTMKTNTAGMINMLELAKTHGARLLQASTSEIYGDPLESPQREDYRGNVNITGPRACYDEGKRAAETLCVDYHREHGVDARIIRIFNTYGPNMDLNDGRAVTNFIVNAIDGKDIVIYGDGSHTRSFQYIDDLLDGIDRMMRHDAFVGPVNLGNPGEITMRELAEKVVQLTGSASRVVFEREATDDPQRRCPDISRARKELAWEPRTSLDEGLAKTIAYFRAIPRPDKKILVFATTYYPDLGPAEQALAELSRLMPDTEFHIVTTRFRSGLPSFERHEAASIHRVGIGSVLDKYLLPILGLIKALSLHKRHQYHFAWSIMASYGGLSAFFFKMIARDVNFLVTLDPEEISLRRAKTRFLIPVYKLIFRNADSVYVSDVNQERRAKLVRPALATALRQPGTRDFLNQVRYTYAELLNRQGHKLERPR